MARQPGFFDVMYRYEALSKVGDPLETLSVAVDFEAFRPFLTKAIRKATAMGGGRPPFDVVLMFKIMILQALNNLSDEQAEFMITDRLSYMRFLGLGFQDKVPDARTIWLYRERLKKADAIDHLSELFDDMLRKNGFLAKGGQIIDATVVEAPRQHLDKEEKAAIKEGKMPEDWSAQKAAHKDVEARWTMKRGKVTTSPDGEIKPQIMVPSFGYKAHTSIDREYGLIRKWTATPASAYDGAQLENLIDRRNTASKVWADTAYRSRKNEEMLDGIGKVSMIHFRRRRGKALDKIHARANTARSKVRSSVEHVFAQQKDRMKLFIRTIGLARAKVKIGLANIAYNMTRLVFLRRSRGVVTA